MERSGETQTATLLLTDVVDSTQVAEELGAERGAALWADHDRLARDRLAEHGGREIDKSDGFLLLFEAPDAAVAFSRAYHAALQTLEPPLTARAGLHVGPVALRENSAEDIARGAKPLEVDGVAKSVAARVMALALGGQTLATSEAVHALGLRHQAGHPSWRHRLPSGARPRPR